MQWYILKYGVPVPIFSLHSFFFFPAAQLRLMQKMTLIQLSSIKREALVSVQYKAVEMIRYNQRSFNRRYARIIVYFFVVSYSMAALVQLVSPDAN